MNNLKIQGNWNSIKGKLKQRYASLTDNDLLYVEGREEELLGRLQRALGQTREDIVNLINTTAGANGSNTRNRPTDPNESGQETGFEESDEDEEDTGEPKGSITEHS